LQFKGIPYAAPPSGDLRWARPQAPKPWSGIREASKYGNACPQLSRYGAAEASYNEDCLYLNVSVPYASAAKDRRLRPVLVWIHGGAFVGGSSALYPLDFMTTSGDLVAVSLNYRLGVFGFMAHPSFDGAWNGGLGLEDQRSALRWIKRNIQAFGGDPSNITIAGESAGAAGVCMHIIAPHETDGLFQKAIVQSAGCVTPLQTVAEGNKTGLKVAEAVGCSDPATALACMRGKPAKDLLDAASKAAGDNLLAYEPSIGSGAIPIQGAEAISSGKFVRVPMINGGNRDEMRLYVAYDAQAGDKVTVDNYGAHIKKLYGQNAEQVAEKYPPSAYSSPSSALGTAMSDFTANIGINNCIYLETAKLASKRIKVYEYVFSDRDAPPVTTDPGFEMGAVHASELPYQFLHFSDTTKVDAPALAAPQQKLANQMMAFWTSFARTGVPLAQDAPPWEPFTGDQSVRRFEPGNLGYFDANHEHNCEFWKALYPSILVE
jgi:para-nitrobenzyl esterase